MTDRYFEDFKKGERFISGGMNIHYLEKRIAEQREKAITLE